MASAERLLAAYRSADADSPRSDDAARADVWSEIDASQTTFRNLLARGQADELSAYLCNVSRHDASVGFTQGDQEFERLQRDHGYRRFVATMTVDKLVSLGEAVGVQPVENPEQGEYGASMRLDPGDLVRRIARQLDLELSPPDLDGGLFKIQTSEGRFHERDLNAVYTAHLLHNTLGGTGTVLEIGGGSGRAAYWSVRMGFTSYTIVDLPRVGVVQGYYLLRALGADRVSLFGEPHSDSVHVKLLPDQALPEIEERRFDLVLNQDSMPEMSRVAADEYLDWIARSARLFLSINHESKPSYGHGASHLSVPELIAERDSFRLKYRFPYWLRKGYVVELYQLETG